MVRYRVSNWASLWKAINQQKRQFNGHLQDLWKAKSPEKGLSRDLNIFFELFKDHLFLLGLFHAGFHNGNVDLQLISGRSICEWDQDGLIVLLANVISDAIKKKKYPHLLRWFYDFPHSINVHFHHFHHFHHVHIQSMFNYSNIIVTRFPWNHYFPNDLFHGFSHDILRSKHSEMKTLATRSDAKDKSSGTPPLPMD